MNNTSASLMYCEEEENYLEHYGRLGMKWYQHIYGDEDGRAKYMDKIKEERTRRFNRVGSKEKSRIAKQTKKMNKAKISAVKNMWESYLDGTILTDKQKKKQAKLDSKAKIEKDKELKLIASAVKKLQDISDMKWVNLEQKYLNDLTAYDVLPVIRTLVNDETGKVETTMRSIELRERNKKK